MKLKVQHLMDATLIVSQIIREQREMPQLGKYRLARLHAKLLPEFTLIDARRDEIIRAYDTKQIVINFDLSETETDRYEVPADKMDEFTTAWLVIGAEEIDIDIQPIPIACLSIDGSDGAIEAGELITLGELITE